MKKFTLYFFLLIIKWSLSLNPNNCYFYFKSDFVEFDLKDLKLKDNEKYIEKEFSLNIGEEIVLGKIFINLCGEIKIPINCKEKIGKSKSSVLFVSDKNDLCVNLINYEKNQNKISLLNPEDKNNNNGFIIEKKEESEKLKKKITPKNTQKNKKTQKKKKKL